VMNWFHRVYRCSFLSGVPGEGHIWGNV
jgi:hypothetical protein